MTKNNTKTFREHIQRFEDTDICDIVNILGSIFKVKYKPSSSRQCSSSVFVYLYKIWGSGFSILNPTYNAIPSEHPVESAIWNQTQLWITPLLSSCQEKQ